MSYWDGTDENLKQLLEDMGIEKWSDVPGWLGELAVHLVDLGWRKSK